MQGSKVSTLDLVLNHCTNKARLKLCATQGGINNQLHCRRSWLFKCFFRSVQVLPSFGASTSSAIRRKRFLRSAQMLLSFSASASFVFRIRPCTSMYSSPSPFQFFAPTTSLLPKHLTHTMVLSFTTLSLQCHHFWARKIKLLSVHGVCFFLLYLSHRLLATFRTSIMPTSHRATRSQVPQQSQAEGSLLR